MFVNILSGYEIQEGILAIIETENWKLCAIFVAKYCQVLTFVYVVIIAFVSIVVDIVSYPFMNKDSNFP